MIKEWRLSNFKSVRQETTLVMAPLTILAGANSSGKSSLIQSMLLVVQSLTSQVTQRPILLNGPLVRLGEFGDIRSFGGANSIRIGWNATGHPSASARQPQAANVLEVSCDLEIAAGESPQSQISQLNPELLAATIRAQNREAQLEESSVSIRRLAKVPAARSQELLTASNPFGSQDGFNYDVDLDEATRSTTLGQTHDREILGCYNQHFIPTGLFLRVDRVEYLAGLICDIDRPISPDSPLMFDAFDRDLWAHIISQLTSEELVQVNGRGLGIDRPPSSLYAWRSSFGFIGFGAPFVDMTHRIRPFVKEYLASNGSSHAILFQEIGGYLRAASDYVLKQFPSSVKYLGPLRDEPRPLQPLGVSAEQGGVGLRGEQSAAVFNLFKDTFITYISSESLASAGEPLVGRVQLKHALLDWLRHMGLAESVAVEDKGKHGHELRLTTEGVPNPHDLTHVGVGVSQVFPILLMCLLAQPDTTLIFEQPELHLHPRVQALLGDFFLSIALSGKQCIIETHSEYLVNRLRYRAAAMNSDTVVEATKIYFAEKHNGSSGFREVNINEFGAIPDWPDGFFDQSQLESDSILRTALKKRRNATS
jgi:predicted ATPase